MISSTSADFRRAVQRLISSSITALIDVSFARLHLSRFSLGHYSLKLRSCQVGNDRRCRRPRSERVEKPLRQREAPGPAVLSAGQHPQHLPAGNRSEEHTSELQSLMRISYAVFCLKKKNKHTP